MGKYTSIDSHKDLSFLVSQVNTILVAYFGNNHFESKLSNNAKTVVIGRVFNAYFHQHERVMNAKIIKLEQLVGLIHD